MTLSPAGRVLVCGSRDYANRRELERILDKLASIFEVKVIIEGEASGADALSKHWALRRGLPVMPFPADWKRHGRRAGPIRNQRMLDEGKPDLVVAFPLAGSIGTWHMINIARDAGVSVWVMPADEAKLDALGEGVYV